MPNIEIERKFLVSGDFKPYASHSDRVVQGYITTPADGNSVRIRIKGGKGYITIKGKSSDDGLSRMEWEKEIPLDEAQQLLQLCHPPVIDKIRYLVKAGNHTYEVDEFYGDNQGLVIAEIELGSPHEAFERPEWLGSEVTGDVRYYNSQLVDNPYKNWKNNP